MTAPSDSALDHWRSVLAATAPAVAVATVLQGILSASSSAVIANGTFVARPGWQATAAAIVWWPAWTLSLSAAMIVMRGALVDAPVSAAFAMKAALRRWAVLLVAILAVGLLTAMILFCAALLQNALGPLVLGLVIAAFALAATSIGVLPLAVLAPENPFSAVSRAWELGAGRRWYMIGLALAVAVPGVAVTWAQPRVTTWASGPLAELLLSLGLAMLSVIVIGWQASILARWFVRLDGGARGLGSRPRPDRWRLGLALLVAAAAALSVVTTLNPWGVPVLSSSTIADDHAGRTIAQGGAVLADGRRLTVSHDGGSRVHFEICGGELYCDTKLLTTFEKPGLVWEYRAAVAVGDGLAIVAVVQQSGDPADEGKLVVWHCPTVACDRTVRTVVGTVSLDRWVGTSPEAGSGRPLLAASADAQGHPLIAWGWAGSMSSVMLLRCGDAACTRSSQDQASLAAEVDGRWPTPVGLGFDAQHRLVAVLAEYAEPSRRSGLQIHIAEPPAPAPLIATVTCRSADCQDRKVRRWSLPQSAYTEVVRPVAGADGRLALVVLRSFIGPGSGYLIRCQTNCG